MVRKITDKVSPAQLTEDLEKYRLCAIELGATDAKVITTDQIIIDERVRAKCIYPKCNYYGTNAHCPPHGMEVAKVKQVVGSYHYAVFTRLQTPSASMSGADPSRPRLQDAAHLKIYEIISRIEAQAFYDGYHLALGFACGPCQRFFCRDAECRVLAGKGCRHPLRARSSMEGAGMDVFRMATQVGWELYPIGRATSPTDVPFAALYGLGLIY